MADFYPLEAGPHYCPECPAQFYRLKDGKRGKRYGVELVCISQNYSGCGCDIGSCPTCGKAWSISYKVSEMERAESFDRDLAKERLASIEYLKRQIVREMTDHQNRINDMTKKVEELEGAE